MKIYLVAAAALVLFLAGWFSNGWRLKSAERRGVEQTLVDLVGAMGKQVDDMERFNSKTAEAEAATIASMRKTQNALQGIRDEIGKSDIGGCNITPAGDSLRERTYRSAVAPKPTP